MGGSRRFEQMCLAIRRPRVRKSPLTRQERLGLAAPVRRCPVKSQVPKLPEPEHHVPAVRRPNGIIEVEALSGQTSQDAARQLQDPDIVVATAAHSHRRALSIRRQAYALVTLRWRGERL